MQDSVREETIAAVKRLLSTDKPRYILVFYWESLRRLIAGRSQEQVSKMESDFCG